MATVSAGSRSFAPVLPATTVALSATSLVHLRSARTKSDSGQLSAFSKRLKRLDQDVSHVPSLKDVSRGVTDAGLQGDQEMLESEEDGDAQALTEFTLFPKLPVEMQDEIWKLCALLQPRTVELQSYLTPDSVQNSQPVVLGQVNHHTRALTFGLHGYVQLRLRKYNRPIVFNPMIDILYLSHKTLMDDDWNKDNVQACLKKAAALDKVRCVALHCRQFAIPKWTSILQNFTSLEILFLVLEQLYPLDGNTFEYLQRDFKFEDIELHEQSTRRWGEEFGLLEFYRQDLQEYLARGKERVAPKVVLVKEIWNLPESCDFWTASFR